MGVVEKRPILSVQKDVGIVMKSIFTISILSLWLLSSSNGIDNSNKDILVKDDTKQRSQSISRLRARRISGLRITSITAHDTGEVADGDGTFFIDVVQTDCDEDSVEPFADTILKVGIVNETDVTAFLKNLSFSVRNADTEGKGFRSRRTAFIGRREVEPTKEVVELTALAFDVRGGLKFFSNNATPIPATLGFRNVKVRVKGRLSNGKAFRAVAKTALSFDEYDRCAE